MKNFCAHRLLYWWFRTVLAMFVMCEDFSPANAQMPPRQIEIGVIPGGLRYNVTEFEAAAGEFIELTLLSNVSSMNSPTAASNSVTLYLSPPGITPISICRGDTCAFEGEKCPHITNIATPVRNHQWSNL